MTLSKHSPPPTQNPPVAPPPYFFSSQSGIQSMDGTICLRYQGAVPRGATVPGTVKYMSGGDVARVSEFECEYAAECLPHDDYNDDNVYALGGESGYKYLRAGLVLCDHPRCATNPSHHPTAPSQPLPPPPANLYKKDIMNAFTAAQPKSDGKDRPRSRGGSGTRSSSKDADATGGGAAGGGGGYGAAGGADFKAGDKAASRPPLTEAEREEVRPLSRRGPSPEPQLYHTALSLSLPPSLPLALPPFPSSQVKQASVSELNLLASLMGASAKEVGDGEGGGGGGGQGAMSSQIFSLNLFPDNDDGVSWGADAKVQTIVVDGNDERKDMAKMMDELDLKDEGAAADMSPFGDEEDDLLALMDHASAK